MDDIVGMTQDNERSLTPPEFHILLALAEREQHGYSIMQTVNERSDGTLRLGAGTLYTSLKRMLDRGWIIETAAPDHAPDEDERRRYYKLTEQGVRVSRAEAERLEKMVFAARKAGLIGGQA